jgi:hypothetical protein
MTDGLTVTSGGINVTGASTFDNAVQADGITVDSTAWFKIGSQSREIYQDVTGSSTVFDGSTTVYQPQKTVNLVSLTANATVNITRAVENVGLTITFVITCDGAGGETLDFTGATTISDGTMTLATTGDVQTITFISNGVKWCEIGRTGPQA